MKKKYPILIPAFNGTSTIAETLASILNQSSVGLASVAKVVIADDCSTDDTPSFVLQHWQHDAPAIEVWQAERNRGERATVNAAFERLLSEGYDWCFVVHQDDIAKPHWLESLAPLMQNGQQPRVSVCSSWDNWYPGIRTDSGHDEPGAPPGIVAGTDDASARTLRIGCWWHFSGSAMQLRPFFEVGAFREDMPHFGDLEWLMRCAFSRKEIAYLPRSLITYRCHAANVSSTSFATNRDIKESLQIYQLHHTDPRISEACRDFLGVQLKNALRRVAVAAVRFQPARLRSAIIIAGKILVALLKQPTIAR
jgi:glycosyltransferase involved in cell wall biosynthesis